MPKQNAANRHQHEQSLVTRAELLDLVRGNPARRQLPLSVRAACDKLRINRRTVIGWCQTDSDFARAYEDAKEDGIDVLEDEATRRAAIGACDAWLSIRLFAFRKRPASLSR